MSEEIRALDEEEILAGLAGLAHWRLEAGCLVRDYRSGGWKATLMVAGVVGTWPRRPGITPRWS